MIALLFALLVFQPQPANTTFAQYCYEPTPDGAVILHFGYTADAPHRYVGDGYNFVTRVGEYPDVLTAVIDSMDAPLSVIALTRVVAVDPVDTVDRMNLGAGETVVIAFDWQTLPVCGQPPTETPTPEPTPTDAPCDAIAIDAATGLPYCYTPDGSGLVPLPPAP